MHTVNNSRKNLGDIAFLHAPKESALQSLTRLFVSMHAYCLTRPEFMLQPRQAKAKYMAMECGVVQDLSCRRTSVQECTKEPTQNATVASVCSRICLVSSSRHGCYPTHTAKQMEVRRGSNLVPLAFKDVPPADTSRLHKVMRFRPFHFTIPPFE
jgi:hypothetical protein